MIIIQNTLKLFLIIIINVLKPGATGGDDETPASKCEFWRRKGKQARAREKRKSRAEKVGILGKKDCFEQTRREKNMVQNDCLSQAQGRLASPAQPSQDDRARTA